MKKSQKSVRAHIRIFMAGIIFSCVNVFALNTNALAAGCTLKFKGGVQYKNIDNATWFTDTGKYDGVFDVFIQRTDGSYADKKPLNDLVSVNAESVNIKLPSKDTTYSVKFKCDTWENGDYFAYYCQYGYYGGEKISVDNGFDYYDKCIPTPAAVLSGGCTLKFNDDTELKNIDDATWFTDGGIYIKKTDGDFADKKPLNDLVSVNDESVDIKLLPPISYVKFKCDKWDDKRSYFAYYCEYDYYGGKKIGSDNGSDFYDECIPKNTEALVDTYLSNGNAGSGGLVAKNALYTTPVGGANVFATMNNMVSRYFGNDRLGGWRDTDGNFNTMRLASDSIAGMVLGTVGGVITNKIIKKNQIKNGLEILKCTVGGHDVATYGEEFQINFEQ